MTDDPELDSKFTAAIQLLVARNTVQETMITQLMLRLAGLFDQPQEFVRLVMTHTEDSLMNGVRQARSEPEEHQEIADLAMTYFQDFSGRLIAALTPKQNPQ